MKGNNVFSFLIFIVIAGVGLAGAWVFWIDTRVIATSFNAEKTLTKDTVPVDVDAVLFWKVPDPKKAALEVAHYLSAISWVAQTALRDVIGKTMDTMQLGSMAGLTALTMGIGQEKSRKENETISSSESTI